MKLSAFMPFLKLSDINFLNEGASLPAIVAHGENFPLMPMAPMDFPIGKDYAFDCAKATTRQRHVGRGRFQERAVPIE